MSFSTATSNLSLPSILLISGSITTSYVLFSSIGDSQRGIIPLLNDKLGKKVEPGLSARQKVRLWNLYFSKAAIQVPGTSILSGLINLSTSYLHPSPFIRRLTLISGLSSIVILPLTLGLGLLPINNTLFAIDKAYDEDVDANAKKNDVKATQLIATWEKKHLIRYLSFVTAWAASFTALVLETRV